MNKEQARQEAIDEVKNLIKSGDMADLTDMFQSGKKAIGEKMWPQFPKVFVSSNFRELSVACGRKEAALATMSAMILAQAKGLIDDISDGLFLVKDDDKMGGKLERNLLIQDINKDDLYHEFKLMIVGIPDYAIMIILEPTDRKGPKSMFNTEPDHAPVSELMH